jgi:hypothetical protein
MSHNETINIEFIKQNLDKIYTEMKMEYCNSNNNNSKDNSNDKLSIEDFDCYFRNAISKFEGN